MMRKNKLFRPNKFSLILFVLILFLVPWPATSPDSCGIFRGDFLCAQVITTFYAPIVSLLTLVYFKNFVMLIIAIIISYLIASLIAYKRNK